MHERQIEALRAELQRAQAEAAQERAAKEAAIAYAARETAARVAAEAEAARARGAAVADTAPTEVPEAQEAPPAAPAAEDAPAVELTPEEAKAAGERGHFGLLVAVARGGTEGAKEEAARALRNLAKTDDSRATIAAAGAIEPLVALVMGGSEGAKEQAAGALAKLAAGLCDNLLTCVARAWDFSKPAIVCPAMNTHMWEHPATAPSVQTLESWGYTVVPPVVKALACGTTGIGAMAHVPTILDAVAAAGATALD